MLKHSLPILVACVLFCGCQETEEVSDGISTELYASSEFEVETNLNNGYPKGNKLAQVKYTDEADKDASFLEFRTRLMEAVQKKDLKFVKSVLAADAWAGKDTERDSTAFIAYYFGNAAKKRPENFWQIMETVLNGGGKFKELNNEKYFIAPYTAVNLLNLPEKVEPLAFVIAQRPNVLVYKQPSVNSEVVDTLNYEVVMADYTKSYGSWLHVKAAQDGYVNQLEVKLPISYRCFFQKQGRKWTIKYLVHGY